ncbi:SDR family NAD(P)-dependent oxidoreductase [Microvirga sp. M2]|uniref:SDR family NAD(P)-dependent oxidoreductase n=1 Tax=Microvirga sp. M2 TaxID=3073270 RepID=UPI0039C27F91
MSALFSLEGKTVLLTGATGHLGRAMSEGLGEAGAHLLINGRDHERVTSLVGELQANGVSAESAVFDVTREEQIVEYFQNRPKLALHALIHNAYYGGSGSIETGEAASYRQSYDVSVVAAHNLMRAALPNLKAAVQEAGDTSFINIASMYGIVSPDPSIYASKQTANPPFYGAAKAAMLQWTRYAACEFGKDGIRVNSISPGPFPSRQVQEDDRVFIHRLSERVPLGRIGVPDELKGPVVFLASGASKYINGANLVVDGGWTCW